MTQPTGREGIANLRADWQAGKATYGAWCAIASAALTEVLCVDGLRYVCLDQQHGFFNDIALIDGFRAIERCGAVPLTRVNANVPWMIGKALDAGAFGVIVPLAETAADAAAAVAACRYPPRGVRSFGPSRAQLFYKPDSAQGFEDALCFVMVETKRGLENVEDIARTPGLDGIYVGPSDLSLGLGHANPPGPQSPELQEAFDRIAAACKRNGIIAGMHCTDGATAGRFAQRGFQLITCFKDTTLMANAAQREIAEHLMATQSKSLTTVHNALTLLDAFSLERPEWGVRELARAYALPQATTSRLVGALCNEGFLARTPAKRYRLNILLHEIGVSAARGSELYAIALPEAVRVRRVCGLATTLCVLDGTDVVVLERLGECEGERHRSPRKRWPVYATCGGKALLAHAPDALLERVLATKKETCTPYTLAQRAALTSALEDVRRDGFATEIQESQLGWCGFAVPIFNPAGRCAGALGVELPHPAWNTATFDKTIGLLRAAATAIGGDLP